MLVPALTNNSFWRLALYEMFEVVMHIDKRWFFGVNNQIPCDKGDLLKSNFTQMGNFAKFLNNTNLFWFICNMTVVVLNIKGNLFFIFWEFDIFVISTKNQSYIYKSNPCINIMFVARSCYFDTQWCSGKSESWKRFDLIWYF